jgi:hypothetical protein
VNNFSYLDVGIEIAGPARPMQRPFRAAILCRCAKVGGRFQRDSPVGQTLALASPASMFGSLSITCHDFWADAPDPDTDGVRPSPQLDWSLFDAAGPSGAASGGDAGPEPSQPCGSDLEGEPVMELRRRGPKGDGNVTAEAVFAPEAGGEEQTAESYSLDVVRELVLPEVFWTALAFNVAAGEHARPARYRLQAHVLTRDVIAPGYLRRIAYFRAVGTQTSGKRLHASSFAPAAIAIASVSSSQAIERTTARWWPAAGVTRWTRETILGWHRHECCGATPHLALADWTVRSGEAPWTK